MPMFPGLAVQGRLKRAESEILDTTNLGPMCAIKKLKFDSASERIDWVERARCAAIVGRCRLSLDSTMSGIRCWSAFASVAMKVFAFLF
jgi:hypothetical protein